MASIIPLMTCNNPISYLRICLQKKGMYRQMAAKLPPRWHIPIMLRESSGAGLYRNRAFELRLIEPGNRQCFTFSPESHD
jgi:hypothetical protein